MRTPAWVAGKGTTRYRSWRTASIAAVTGFAARAARLCSAVFQAESTSTITSGSRPAISSQEKEAHVSATSAATLPRPAVSMISCGAPIPPPT